jgi:hypothetical protein
LNALHMKPDCVARNPGTIAVLKHFFFPLCDQAVPGTSADSIMGDFQEMALRWADRIREGPDLTLALRDLLAARDGFLRALVE